MASDNQIYRAMGKLIRARRQQAKLTQNDLAQRINLTRTSITNIERGRQKIQVHTLYSIAVALEVQPSALLPSLENHELKAISERVKRLPPEEREFAKSVLTQKSSS